MDHWLSRDLTITKSARASTKVLAHITRALLIAQTRVTLITPSNVATMYIFYDPDDGNVIKIGAFPADNA
jgi:hypothetical protein